MQFKSAEKLFLTYQFGKNKEFDNILCVQDKGATGTVTHDC